LGVVGDTPKGFGKVWKKRRPALGKGEKKNPEPNRNASTRPGCSTRPSITCQWGTTGRRKGKKPLDNKRGQKVTKNRANLSDLCVNTLEKRKNPREGGLPTRARGKKFGISKQKEGGKGRKYKDRKEGHITEGGKKKEVEKPKPRLLANVPGGKVRDSPKWSNKGDLMGGPWGEELEWLGGKGERGGGQRAKKGELLSEDEQKTFGGVA